MQAKVSLLGHRAHPVEFRVYMKAVLYESFLERPQVRIVPDPAPVDHGVVVKVMGPAYAAAIGMDGRGTTLTYVCRMFRGMSWRAMSWRSARTLSAGGPATGSQYFLSAAAVDVPPRRL